MAVIIIITGTSVFFSQPIGEKILAEYLQKQLSTILGQPVHIGKLETNIISHLTLVNLEIQNQALPDSVDFLKLSSLDVDYQLASLILGKLVIKRIDVAGLIVTVQRDSTGTYNFPSLKPSTQTASKKKKSPLSVVLKQINLDDTNITFNDRTTEFPPLIIPQLQASAILKNNTDYRFTVEIDSNEVSQQETPLNVEYLLIDGQYVSDTLILDDLQCQLPGLFLSAKGSTKLGDRHPSLNYALMVSGNGLELSHIFADYLPDQLYPVSGHFELASSVTGTVKNPTASLQITSPAIKLNQLTVKSLDIEADYAEKRCHLKNLSGNLFDGHFGLSGTLNLDSVYSFEVTSAISDLNLSDIWQFAYGSKSPYRGILQGHLEAAGAVESLDQISLYSVVQMTQASYHGKRIDDFEAAVNIASGEANVNFSGEQLSGKGLVQIRNRKISGNFSADLNRIDPIAGLLNIPALKGSLRISGDLSGPVDSPDLEATIEGDHISYQDIPLDCLRARLHTKEQKIFVDELNFGGNLTLSDSSDLPFDTRDLAGTIDYSGSLRGSLDDPQGFVRVNLIKPEFKSFRFDKGFLYFTFGGGKVSLDPLELTLDTLTAKAFADFDLDTYKGKVSVDLTNNSGQPTAGHLLVAGIEYEISDFSHIAVNGALTVGELQYLGTFIPNIPDVKGMLKIDFETMGVPARPSGQVEYSLYHPTFGSATVDSISGRIKFSQQQIEFDALDIFYEGLRSTISADLGLIDNKKGKPTITGESSFSGSATGQKLPLEIINPFLPEGYSIAGDGNFDISWGGTFNRILPSGEVRVVSGLINWGIDKPQFSDLFVDLSLQDDTLKVDRFTGSFGNVPFDMEALVQTQDLKSFAVDVQMDISDIGVVQTGGIIAKDNISTRSKVSQLNLKLLQPFLPQFGEINGILNTEVTLTGDPLDPQIDGFLDVHDFGIQIEELDEPLADGVIKVHFNRNDVKIDSLFVHKGKGWINTQGTLTHKDQTITKIDVTTAVKNFTYNQPKQWNCIINSAELRYYNEADNYRLEGDVTLGKSKVLVNFQPQALLPFTQTVEKPSTDLPEFIAKTQLEVRIRDSQDIWIDNNIARLRLHPEMEIIGTPAKLNFAGRLAIEEGYVLFLDRKFKMSRGIIDFIDPQRINPIVDLQAETTVRNYQALEATEYSITLTVSGPMDQAVVELTSDPPLERSDILSLLTLGATREQLTGNSLEQNDPSKTDILLDRAGELSSRKVSGYLSRNLTSVTGLDEVSIEGNLFKFGKSWGPRLVASKKITDRMEVTYTTNVGHFNERSVRIDYRLSKYFWLESETDQLGKAGLDLKYKIKLK